MTTNEPKDEWQNARGCLMLIAINCIFFIMLSCKLVGLWKISWHLVFLPLYVEMLAVLVAACCVHTQNFKNSLKK